MISGILQGEVYISSESKTISSIDAKTVSFVQILSENSGCRVN